MRRGRSSLLHLHLGPWRTSLLIKSHFWLFPLRVRACLRWGHWQCPSCACHRGPGHTWTGKKTTGSVSRRQWSPSRSGAEEELTAVWSRSLHRFHPLLTWWYSAVSPQWDPPAGSHSEDQQLLHCLSRKSFSYMKCGNSLICVSLSFFWHSLSRGCSDIIWPLDGDFISLLDWWISSAFKCVSTTHRE